MSDLEESIQQWRRELAAAGIKEDQVLDELESHLREDVERQMRAGETPDDAFASAVERMGEAKPLRAAFAEIEKPRGCVVNMLCVLAGIPGTPIQTPMNIASPISGLEPRWATYCKASLSLFPALFLWAVLMATPLLPVLTQLCGEAGMSLPGYYRIPPFLWKHGVLFSFLFIGAFMLLEGASEKWPKYRRATMGLIVFLVNSAVLFLITTMVVLALDAHGNIQIREAALAKAAVVGAKH